MNTISMFELVYPTFKINKPVRLIELFAGVGSQAMALRNIGVEFEHYKVVEFDKYAIASYNSIHNTNFETMDITKVKGIDLEITNTNGFDYIMTYSFPCQDLSVAGNQKGMSKNSGTRSGLLWEVERLLNEVEELPQVLLMENVPQVISDVNILDFHLWQRFLENKGYSNYVDTLNAKDYGVAQNRNRTFMVSILGEYHYKFPQPEQLTKTMKDYLEDEVEEKYYINNEKAQNLIQQLIDGGQLKNNIECADGSINEPKTREIMNCITARYDCGISNQKSIGGVVIEPLLVMDYRYDEGCRVRKDGNSPTLMTKAGGTSLSGQTLLVEPMIVASRGRNKENPSDRSKGTEMEQRLEPNSQGLCNTLTSVQKDNLVLEPAILTPKRTEYGKAIRKDYESGKIEESRHNMTELQPRNDGICNTLTTVQKDNYLIEPTVKVRQATKEGYIECKLGGVADLSYPDSKTRRGRVQDNGDICPTLTATETGVHKIESLYRIRKLTPLECWRLMGFTDEDYYKAEKVNSNSQLYKQAGNSIVVDVLEGIFKQMI